MRVVRKRTGLVSGLPGNDRVTAQLRRKLSVCTPSVRSDASQVPQLRWSTGKEERVYTGHADGRNTINLREADTVEREKTRVLFQEAHRTVVGHFRHEIAHYFWQMQVHNQCDNRLTRSRWF